jgi:hypothetical protein
VRRFSLLMQQLSNCKLKSPSRSQRQSDSHLAEGLGRYRGEEAVAPNSRVARSIFHFVPKGDTQVLEMLIGQVREKGNIDLVLDESVDLFGHAEFF